MLKNQKVWLPQCVEFSSYLDMDSRCFWRIFVMDAGEKLRLDVVVPGHTPKEKVLDMVQSGRFDRYVPDIVEEWYWWIEKW